MVLDRTGTTVSLVMVVLVPSESCEVEVHDDVVSEREVTVTSKVDVMVVVTLPAV